jgi:hypothetical protein
VSAALSRQRGHTGCLQKEGIMQLVNAIDIPFESQLNFNRKVRDFIGMCAQEIVGIWVGLRKALPAAAAPASQIARAPNALPGYYGEAHDRLRASMPIVSYVECIGADPFLQAPASPRGTVASHKAGPASGPGGEEDTWLAVLSADWVIPARMM